MSHCALDRLPADPPAGGERAGGFPHRESSDFIEPVAIDYLGQQLGDGGPDPHRLSPPYTR